jgi:hypothetical protein
MDGGEEPSYLPCMCHRRRATGSRLRH